MLFDKFITIVLVVLIVLVIFNFYRKEISPLSYALISILSYLIIDNLVDYNMVNINISGNNQSNNTTKVTDNKQTTKQNVEQPTLSDEDSNGPLDGLSPNELSKRLQYLYYATSHPKEKVSYVDYETYHDKVVARDGSSLAGNDENLIARTRTQYPDLTAQQINARDCMNEMGEKSCYQTLVVPNNTNVNNILKDGLNKDNVKQVIREDFTCPGLVQDVNPLKPLFINAPGNPNEKQYNISNLLCRGCTVDSCKSCNEHNELFI